MADKHTIIIIILLILFVGSLGYSFLGKGGSDSELEDLRKNILELEREKTELEEKKSSLEESRSELEAKIAKADGLVKGEREVDDDRNIYEVEKASPFDHVKSSQIRVMKNKVEINMENVAWWEIADTNSMDPLIDIGSVALSIKPKTTNDIHLGDVGLYNSKIAKTVIIHRIIKIDSDQEGWYSKFRGDNLKRIDPENVRFEQMEGIVVGVIY